MNLKLYVGKRVRLTSCTNKTFVGIVTDYIYADDNDPEIEGIVMDYPVRGDGYKYENPVEFDAPEIKSIEIIE